MAARPPGTRSTEAVRDAGQLDFFRDLWAKWTRPAASPAIPEGDHDQLVLATGTVSVMYVRHPRARRYRLLFRRDGTARCTIPRRGTLAEARRFVAENDTWLAERLKAHLAGPRAPQPLRPGGSCFLGGEDVTLVVAPVAEGEAAVARLGEIEFKADLAVPDLRPQAEAALRKFAARTLPKLTTELAAQHGLVGNVRCVSVRAQRTRWGSCSRRGVISLNWRLVQTPNFVRDYVILHELAHLRHLNHSARFWAEVARLCPEHARAEAWLKQHGKLVL